MKVQYMFYLHDFVLNAWLFLFPYTCFLTPPRLGLRSENTPAYLSVGTPADHLDSVSVQQFVTDQG